MEQVAQLNISEQDWLSEPLQEILNILNDAATNAGFDRGALIVGGAVRNCILSKGVNDVDLATIFPPSEVLPLLGDRGVRTLPTGIDHGTITAVLRKEKFELTTLRKDVGTDGRHADVEYTRSWAQDARRRDFTMNALYMDVEGNIYDPLGQGYEDAKAGRVLFVGDPNTRIKEDYLRILRFFRIWGSYGIGDIDAAGLNACLQNLGGLSKLSKERIASEFVKILLAERAEDVLSLLFKHKILSEYLGETQDLPRFKRLMDAQARFKCDDVTARLFLASGDNSALLGQYPALLFLPKPQKKMLTSIVQMQAHEWGEDIPALKRAMYFYGQDAVIQSLLIDISKKPSIDFDALEALVEFIRGWDVPECPVSGDDLKSHGLPEGRILGEKLEALEKQWLDSDFTLSKDDLLAEI